MGGGKLPPIGHTHDKTQNQPTNNIQKDTRRRLGCSDGYHPYLHYVQTHQIARMKHVIFIDCLSFNKTAILKSALPCG